MGKHAKTWSNANPRTLSSSNYMILQEMGAISILTLELLGQIFLIIIVLVVAFLTGFLLLVIFAMKGSHMASKIILSILDSSRKLLEFFIRKISPNSFSEGIVSSARHSKRETAVRLFKLDDLESVCNIERVSIPSFWRRPLLKLMHFKNPEGFFVAEKDGKVVGYAISEIVKRLEFGEFRLKRRGHLLYIAVDPEYRDQGFGNMLMETVFHYLKKHGARDIWLEVPILLVAARNFYSKLGFKETLRKEKYYLNADAVIMTKEL